MKLSASIYSNHSKDLSSLIEELDAYYVDYFHIDCMDDPNVFEDIQRIRQTSKTPVDLHLITPDPAKYWDAIAEQRVEYLTLQYENLHVKPYIPEDLTAQLGLAIVSETPVEVFEEYADTCSFVLFMTTTPGQSGGVFDSNTFRRIRQFRTLFPNVKIHVDGGVNAEVSFILRNLGVDTSVIGSYLFKGDFIGSAMMKLRSDNIKSHYCVKDFMQQYDEVPVIPMAEASFQKILQSIDDYHMGFTMLSSDEGRLEGIISNADIRKGLLKKIPHIEQLDIFSIINRNPAYVYEDMTVSELLGFVKNLSFPVLYLPVVDRQKKITGTIKFNNLIKGES